jgi:hypothetical protein
MPRYDDSDDESFDYGSLPDVQQQEFLYDLIGFTGNAVDPELREMFWDVMYNDELSIGERLDIYQSLSDYIYDEYGMYFEDIWDWEDFRAWYDSQ